MTDKLVYDVAVVGAGLSGLVCAQQLQLKGYSVIVFDKSRGLGGRFATRRLHNTSKVDHGIPYLQVQGRESQQLIIKLCEANILHLWQGKIYHLDETENLTIANSPFYIAPAGMRAIAKFLAQDLEILRESKVTKISPNVVSTWNLTRESDFNNITARALVIAIPAPQALSLIEDSNLGNLSQINDKQAIGSNTEEENNYPLDSNSRLPQLLIQDLAAVEFDPCITVMAGYNPQKQQDVDWQAIEISNHPDLRWIGLDSSKRQTSYPPIFVLHSAPNFAKTYLENPNLEKVGSKLLEIAAQMFIPWLNQPEWYQVHRWRYAFPRRSLGRANLITIQPLPLVFCGDWCLGNLVEGALTSGLEAASKLEQIFKQAGI